MVTTAPAGVVSLANRVSLQPAHQRLWQAATRDVLPPVWLCPVPGGHHRSCPTARSAASPQQAKKRRGTVQPVYPVVDYAGNGHQAVKQHGKGRLQRVPAQLRHELRPQYARILDASRAGAAPRATGNGLRGRHQALLVKHYFST